MNQIDHTGIGHILIDDVLKIVSEYDQPGASRLKTYELELTLSEKIIRVALIIFTFGIWRVIQNWRIRNALFLGGNGSISTAVSAIKLGAARYLDGDDLRKLAEKNKMDSIEFLVSIEPKTQSTECDWRREKEWWTFYDVGHVFPECGWCHLRPEIASFNYLARKLKYNYNYDVNPPRDFFQFFKIEELEKLDEADLKILDVYLKYRMVPDLSKISIKVNRFCRATCESQFQLHLWNLSFKNGPPNVRAIVQKHVSYVSDEDVLSKKFNYYRYYHE